MKENVARRPDLGNGIRGAQTDQALDGLTQSGHPGEDSIMDLRDLDFFLISYDEPEAEARYEELRRSLPRLQRIHGVEGEFNAWREAARRSTTPHFAKIDCDTRLKPGFSFRIPGYRADDRSVQVWRSLNAVNGLVYGNGSIHLLSREHVLSTPAPTTIDPTMGIATCGFRIQEECATVNCFNSNPLQTWRSAFRECARMASANNVFPKTMFDERATEAKLKIWTSIGADAENGRFSILGARMGTLYGFEIRERPALLENLRGYAWSLKRWEEEVIGADPHALSAAYAHRLRAERNFETQDYSAEQSRFLKGLWYSIPVDVMTRLGSGAELETPLNY